MKQYNHKPNTKKIKQRPIKQHSDPYCEHDPDLNLWPDENIDPNYRYIRHLIPKSVYFAFISIGIYFIAKLIFLFYNAGDAINVILTSQGYGK